MSDPRKPEPGEAPEDPARRPGQPGAERDQAASAETLPAGRRPPGTYDERQIPLDRVRTDEPPADPAEPGPEQLPLSDGSTRSGPV